MAEITASVGGDESVLMRELLRDAAAGSGSRSVWTTLTSFLVMSFGATKLFVALQRGLNQIWHVPRPEGDLRRRVRVVLHKRALAYLMALASGLVMLVVVLVRLLLVTWCRGNRASRTTGRPGLELTWYTLAVEHPLY